VPHFLLHHAQYLPQNIACPGAKYLILFEIRFGFTWQFALNTQGFGRKSLTMAAPTIGG
jgi:hypothetical protein